LAIIDKPVEVTDATLPEFLKEHSLAVVDFWHPLCGPCKALHPVIDELARQYAGKCAFAKLNTDDNGRINPSIREKYHLFFGVPTLEVYKNGELIDYFCGPATTTPPIIRQVINYHIETQ
jgi:thioredoxin 1